MSDIYLYIDGFPVLASKDWVNHYAMLLFTETDKKIFERKLKDRPYFVSWYPGEKKDYAGFSETVYQYRTTVEIALARLEILGCTSTKIQNSLERRIKERCRLLEESLKNITTPNGGHFIEEEIQVIKNSDFESFKRAFQEIKENRFTINNFESKKLSNLAKSLLRRSHYDWQYYYPDQHPLNYLRFILECCKSSADVTLDFTDLVRSGWVKADIEIRDISIKNTSRDHEIFSKILVITEGSTDAEILSKAIKLRHPHLSDYYLFMPYNLEEGGVPVINGCASLTVQRIEAFAKCEINNRIIGLLDNDKASVDAKNCIKITLPPNIKLINYPDIDLAKTYPCVQPDRTENVNGRAAAIEMYCGRDVLTSNTPNKLYPIQWTKKPDQGNFGGAKKEIQRKIREKLNACEEDRSKINNYDWSGIDAIFEALFRCFQE
jgi:hypothetical protein